MPDWLFPCNTITFQKYFWCSQFSRFDCKSTLFCSDEFGTCILLDSQDKSALAKFLWAENCSCEGDYEFYFGSSCWINKQGVGWGKWCIGPRGTTIHGLFRYVPLFRVWLQWQFYGRGPPLFLDQTETQRAEKKLETPPLPPSSEGLDLPLGR